MVMWLKLISMVYIMYQLLKILKQLHGVQVKKDLANSIMKSGIKKLFQDQVTMIQKTIMEVNTCFQALKITELEKWCLISVAMTLEKENLCLRHQVQVHIKPPVNLDILKVTNFNYKKHHKIRQEALWELLIQHKMEVDHKSVMVLDIAEEATTQCIIQSVLPHKLKDQLFQNIWKWEIEEDHLQWHQINKNADKESWTNMFIGQYYRNH